MSLSTMARTCRSTRFIPCFTCGMRSCPVDSTLLKIWKPTIGCTVGQFYDYFLQHNGIHADVNHSAVVKLTQFIHVLNRHQLQMRDHMSIMPHDDEICILEFGMNILLLRNCGLVTDGPGPQNLDMQGNVDMAELAVWVAQAKASNPVAD
jgi:hypothetical protein